MKKNKNGKKEITISGVINAIEWDDEGNVISVELSTDDLDYIIEPNQLGKELFDCIGEEVEVVGSVTQDSDKNDCIRITSYKIIDFYDDEDEDDDDYYFDDDDDDFYDD